ELREAKLQGLGPDSLLKRFPGAALASGEGAQVRFAGAPRKKVVHDFFRDEAVCGGRPSRVFPAPVSVATDRSRPGSAARCPGGDWGDAPRERSRACLGGQDMARANVDLGDQALDLVEAVLPLLGLRSQLFRGPPERRFRRS